MNDNGIWNQGSHRRIFYRKDAVYQEWGITLPAAKTGTGAEEKFTDFAAIPKPYPVGVGVFSVPSVQLELDAGGALTVAVEFWGESDNEEDEDGLLSQENIHTLSTINTQNYQDYGLLGEADVSCGTGETGTFRSDWVTVSPIPAGSGWIVGASGLYGLEGGFQLADNGSLLPMSWAGSGSIELGDADGNVIQVIEIMHHTAAHDDVSGAVHVEQDSATCTPITWTTPICKVRVRLDVASSSNAASSFSAYQLNLRRFYG
jgi:hypothetical protein